MTVQPPTWFGEVFEPFTKVLRKAWSFVQSADDAALMVAFETAKSESGIAAVEAKKATTLRRRLGKVVGDYYDPNILLLFWMALCLDAARGEALLRQALMVRVADDPSSARLQPHFVAIAARMFWSADEVRGALLEALVRQQDDPRYGGVVHGLGHALAAKEGVTTDEIRERAEDLAAGSVPGQPQVLIDSLCVACVALVARDRRRFKPVVKDLGARLAGYLGPSWKNLVVQCVNAVVRRP